MERLFGKQHRVRYLVIKDQGWHAINKIVGSEYRITPKPEGYMSMNQECPSSFNKVSVFAFSNPVLLKGVGTGCLVKNSMGSHKISKWLRQVLSCIITT